jgi:hypothetical protein
MLELDPFLVLPFLPITFLGKSLQLLFFMGPFLTPLNICFAIASYNALVNALILPFHFKGFLVLFQHKNLFQ